MCLYTEIKARTSPFAWGISWRPYLNFKCAVCMIPRHAAKRQLYVVRATILGMGALVFRSQRLDPLDDCCETELCKGA